MIIYFLMVVYVFLIGVIAKQRVVNGASVSKNNNYTNLVFAVLIFALPIFFIGFRTNVADTLGYINSFLAQKTVFPDLSNGIFASRGIGWDIYAWFIKKFITNDPYVFLFITAIIQAGALIKFYYNYSTNYPYSVLLFFLSCSFTMMINGLRQMLATCLILYFSRYIFEKKYVRFLFVVFLAMTVHLSAIVWVLFVFIVQGKPGNIKTIIFGIIVIFAVVFTDQFTSILSDAISDTSYAGYTNQFQKDDGSNIFHTLIAIVPLVVAFIGRDKLKGLNDKITYILLNIAIVNVFFNLLANFTSGILMGRLTGYFSLFIYALFPRMFDQLFNEKIQHELYLWCAIGHLAYFLYYLFSQHIVYNSIPLHINL